MSGKTGKKLSSVSYLAKIDSAAGHIEFAKNVDGTQGFALETSSHKCRGCQKNMPLGCLRKKSTFMITVFLHNSIQTISNQVHIQNLTYNYTIIKYTNLYINLN